MKKNYYKSEFSDRAWARLISVAKQEGYAVEEHTASAEIDTTERETEIMKACNIGPDNFGARLEWADYMHKKLEEDARQCRYIAVNGAADEFLWGAVVFKSFSAARDYCDKMERESMNTQAWRVVVSCEY